MHAEPSTRARFVTVLLVAFGVCLAACALGSPATAFAQQAAAESSDAKRDAKPAPVKPIPIADILTHVDDDQRVIERANRKAQERNPSSRLAEDLKRIADSVNEKAGALPPDELRGLPVMRLESLDRHWRFDLRRFERWQADMRQALLPYSDLAADLARRRAEWEATREALGKDGAPAALSGRIDSVLGELSAAEGKLSEPLAQLIDLGRRANVVNARIQANRSEVAAAIANVDSRLMRIDEPPLWEVPSERASGADSIQSIEQGVAVEARFAREYGNTALVHGLRVLQLLLLPLVLWLAWLHRRNPAPGGDAKTHQVLSRPISTWVLLAMLMLMAFETDAPLLVTELAFLAALVPLLRLIPRESREALGLWPYVAIAMYVLDRLCLVLLSNSHLYRISQLALAVLGMLLTLWLLWRGRSSDVVAEAPPPADAPPPWLRPWVRGFGWLGVVVMGLSALANLLGNVSLGETLLSGLVDSGYLGLMLYAGVTVGIALLRTLLAQGFVMKLRFASANAGSIERLFSRGFMIAAALAWVVYAMQAFRVLRPIGAVLGSVLGHRFEVGALSISVGNVLVFALSVVIAMWAARLVQVLLRDEVLGRMSLPRGVGNSVASLSYYAVLILGFLVALSAAGFQVSQLALVFGALGVGIGFGLQNVVNNFVSGLVLMFERPVQPGDVIDIAGVSGQVREIRMRATIIRTFDGADVVVPNGSLLSGNLVNWTLMDHSRRFEIAVGVAYGSDPQQVLALLNEVARGTPGVATHPAPFALMRDFGPSALQFAVRAWTHDHDNWSMIRSDMVTRIYAAFNAAAIDISFNQIDVHLRSVADTAGAALGGVATLQTPAPAAPPATPHK